MIIGLTGGIATGKSNVSRYLARHGYSIVDADKITHAVQSKGQPGLSAIVRAFGKSFLTANGDLNRSKLGARVFTHKSALRKLVRVIDPFIRQTVIQKMRRDSEKTNRIVLDAPTLFENGYQYLVDQIWVIACSPMVQMQRLRSRDRLSISDAQSRMGSQWPLTIKEALADVIINSNGSKRQTLAQVKKLIDRD